MPDGGSTVCGLCRTDKLDVRNKINEGPSARWVNFVSETVIEE